MEKIQFKYLWITVAVSVFMYFLFFILNSVQSNVFSNFLSIELFHILYYSFPILFLGLDLKNWKTALAGFIIFLVVWSICVYIPIFKEWIAVLRYLPAIFGFFVLAYFSDLSIKRKWIFTLTASLLFWGVGGTISSVFNHFDRTIVGNLIEDLVRNSELTQIPNNLDFIFELPLIYIFGLCLFQFISEFKSFKELNSINVDNQSLSKSKSIAIFFYGHFGTLLVSIGIFYSIFQMFVLKERFEKYSTFFELDVLFMLFKGLFSLLIILFFFRNFLLEFYLNHLKSISWNFFFLNVPFLGFMIWIINILSWDKLKFSEKSHQKLYEIQNQDRVTLKFVFIALIFLYLLLRGMVLLREGSMVELGLLSASFLFLVVYVYYRYGLHILLIINTLGFLVFLLIELRPELFEIENNRGNPNYFYSFTYFFLIYPIFFLNHFKIIAPSIEKKEHTIV